MLLNSEQFLEKAKLIAGLPSGEIGIDFETTGLRPYGKDRVGIVGFTDPGGAKYCSYIEFYPAEYTSREALRILCSNPKLQYCAHNAKFEMGFLHQMNIGIKAPVWDTEVMARIEYNNHMRYDLDSCAKRIGEKKYEPMGAWLKIRGNKGAHLQAPPEILQPYVEHDAWLSWRLRRHQVEVFKHWDMSSPTKIKPVVNLERAVLLPLFEMERRGLYVDVGYCKQAAQYEREEIAKAKAEFAAHANVEFVDSRKTLAPVFDAHGIRYGATAIGNPSFTEDSIAGSREHPVVAALLKHRRATKRLSAYWENFLDLEENGIIHPSINQNRAQTGRMSISDPSAQNWSTDEDAHTMFPIRRAFIARPGCVIASLDYSQMELRKGADESDDFDLIGRIKNGADLHQEVADIAGVPRSLAKNGRFAKQYGAGVPRIATTLGISESLARTISIAIDQQARRMTAYSYMLSRTCKPYGTDWLGRRFFFDQGFEYKAFNYRIQGGCAEILKIAIVEVQQFLKVHARETTFMLVPIHDELVLNLDERDLHLLPQIKQIMVAAHRDKKHLEMDVGIMVGPNFHDLLEWEAA